MIDGIVSAIKIRRRRHSSTSIIGDRNACELNLCNPLHVYVDTLTLPAVSAITDMFSCSSIVSDVICPSFPSVRPYSDI